MKAWRIVKEKHAATAFDGEGARRFGGRWNSVGTSLVYSSGSRALAVVESLVHLNPPVTFRYSVFPVEFDEGLVERATSLPADWTEEPPPVSTRKIGDLWVKEGRSVVLEVPSVIVPSEPNYLLNPSHPDFKKIVIGNAETFFFDPRFL